MKSKLPDLVVFAADGPLQKEFIKIEHTELDTTTTGTKTETFIERHVQKWSNVTSGSRNMN